MPETPRNISSSIASFSPSSSDAQKFGVLKGNEEVEKIKEIIQALLDEEPPSKGVNLDEHLQALTDKLRKHSFGSAINPIRFIGSRYISGISFRITQAREEILSPIKEYQKKIDEFLTYQPLNNFENLETFTKLFHETATITFNRCIDYEPTRTKAELLSREAARSAETTFEDADGLSISLSKLISNHKTEDLNKAIVINNQLKKLAPKASKNQEDAYDFMRTLYLRDIDNVLLMAPYIAPVIDGNGVQSPLRHSGNLEHRKIKKLSENQFEIASTYTIVLKSEKRVIASKEISFKFFATFIPNDPKNPAFVFSPGSVQVSKPTKINDTALYQVMQEASER